MSCKRPKHQVFKPMLLNVKSESRSFESKSFKIVTQPEPSRCDSSEQDCNLVFKFARFGISGLTNTSGTWAECTLTVPGCDHYQGQARSIALVKVKYSRSMFQGPVHHVVVICLDGVQNVL